MRRCCPRPCWARRPRASSGGGGAIPACAFYDLRELAAVDPDAQMLDAYFSTEGTAAAAPRSVELVAKACSAGFADEGDRAVAQKECLKLGNVVRVHGAWRVCEGDGAKYLEARVPLDGVRHTSGGPMPTRACTSRNRRRLTPPERLPT